MNIKNKIVVKKWMLNVNLVILIWKKMIFVNITKILTVVQKDFYNKTPTNQGSKGKETYLMVKEVGKILKGECQKVILGKWNFKDQILLRKEIWQQLNDGKKPENQLLKSWHSKYRLCAKLIGNHCSDALKLMI